MYHIKRCVSGMYRHVFVCICMYLVYIRFSISMYLKNYVFVSLYKFQLHVCACMILFLLKFAAVSDAVSGDNCD